MMDPNVTPTGFSEEPDGAVVVDVHQVVRDKEGNVMAERDVQHVYVSQGRARVSDGCSPRRRLGVGATDAALHVS